MKNWFWPGITCTAFLTSTALWFGIQNLESDLSAQVSLALAPHPWTQFDMDGRDLTLKGVAPDPQLQRAALDAVQTISGIRAVEDLTALLPLAEPFQFTISKNADGIVLSGFIPAGGARETITQLAEDSAPGMLVIDDLALARGYPPSFMEIAAFAVSQMRYLRDGEVSLSGDELTIKGRALDGASYQVLTDGFAKSIPVAAALTQLDIMHP